VTLTTEENARDVSFDVDVGEALGDLRLHLEVIVVDEAVVADLGGCFAEEDRETLLVVVDAEVTVSLTLRATEAASDHLWASPRFVEERVSERLDRGEATFPSTMIGTVKCWNSSIETITRQTLRVLNLLVR
jgi:hypothetical protein